MTAPRDARIDIERLDETDSTNAAARRAAESGDLGDVPRLFVATRQTSGVGRHGRRWESPEGGLWCTLAWPHAGDPSGVLTGLGLRVGLAIRATIASILEEADASGQVALKWPNDVLIDDRKASGCLCQAVPRGGSGRRVTWLLLGVGVNVNNPMRDEPALSGVRAISIAEATGRAASIDAVRERLAERLRDAVTTEGLSESMLDEIRDVLHGRGEPVRVTTADGPLTGRLLDIDHEGAMILAPESGGTPFRCAVGGVEVLP